MRVYFQHPEQTSSKASTCDTSGTRSNTTVLDGFCSNIKRGHRRANSDSSIATQSTLGNSIFDAEASRKQNCSPLSNCRCVDEEHQVPARCVSYHPCSDRCCPYQDSEDLSTQSRDYIEPAFRKTVYLNLPCCPKIRILIFAPESKFQNFFDLFKTGMDIDIQLHSRGISAEGQGIFQVPFAKMASEQHSNWTKVSEPEHNFECLILAKQITSLLRGNYNIKSNLPQLKLSIHKLHGIPFSLVGQFLEQDEEDL